MGDSHDNSGDEGAVKPTDEQLARFRAAAERYLEDHPDTTFTNPEITSAVLGGLDDDDARVLGMDRAKRNRTVAGMRRKAGAQARAEADATRTEVGQHIKAVLEAGYYLVIVPPNGMQQLMVATAPAAQPAAAAEVAPAKPATKPVAKSVAKPAPKPSKSDRVHAEAAAKHAAKSGRAAVSKKRPEKTKARRHERERDRPRRRRGKGSRFHEDYDRVLVGEEPRDGESLNSDDDSSSDDEYESSFIDDPSEDSDDGGSSGSEEVPRKRRA